MQRVGVISRFLFSEGISSTFVVRVRRHHAVRRKYFYRHVHEKEKKQNDEALRILEKKYIEEKISKQEYLKRKKEFEETKYHPIKCKVCGSEEFEFVWSCCPAPPWE